MLCCSTKSLSLPPKSFLTIATYSSVPYTSDFALFTNPSNPYFSLRPHQTSHAHKTHNPFVHFPSKFQHFHHPLLASTQPSSIVPSPDHQSHEIKNAQIAISEFLQEFGISQDDSTFISLNSPRYLKMLIDGVRELDELELLSSWKSEKDGKELVEFKEKVRYMAETKGDGGKVAFLESVVGLSLSSAMNVARYLSTERLTDLVCKVKYMKKIFFSGSNDGILTGKNARRMMMHLSIPVDEHLQQTLSFFEKIEARRGGLDMLGSEDTSFHYLVESFPRLLLLSPESHMKALVKYLENIGVSGGGIRNVLLLFPPIILCKVEVIKARVQAFKEVSVEDKDFGKVLIKYPWILSTSIQENYKDVLSFFEMEKVPKISVCRAIRSWPYLLGCSTNKLKLMIEEIDNLGIRNKKMGQVIRKSPQILLQKPEEFLQVVSFFEGLRFDKESVGGVLGRCPEIFCSSINDTLEKKIRFLAAIGISRAHIPRVIKKYPELLVCNTHRTLLPRMKYLINIGLSGRDVAFMVRRFSPLLGYSIDEVLRPKLEFLINTMEKPVKEVVDYPRYFSYSLENRIKPRFWVLKGRSIECSLKDMLGKNDEEFAAEFMEGRFPISASSDSFL